MLKPKLNKIRIALLIGCLFGLAIAQITTTFFHFETAWIKGTGPEDPLEAWSEDSYIVWQYNSTFYACRNMSTLMVEAFSDNDTETLQYAINETTTWGGTVTVKAATYTGTYAAIVTLKDNVTLILQKGALNITVTIDSGADATLIDEENGYRQEWVAGSVYSLLDYRTGEFWYGGSNRTDLIVNPTSEASIIIEKDGSNCVMTNCSTGQRDAISTNADNIFDWAIGNMTDGGILFVRQGSYSDVSLVFDGGYVDSKEWILQGEGVNTILTQTGAGESVITIRNGTRVTIENLYISVGNSAFSGIYCANDGDVTETSLRRGRISDVVIQGGGSGSKLLYLVDISDCYFEHIRVESVTSGVFPIVIENNSTTTNYGNSHFDACSVYADQTGTPLVLMNETTGSTTYMLNLITFTHLECYGSGAGSKVGMIGVQLANKVSYCSFFYTLIENCETGIKIGGNGANKDTAYNSFNEGFIGQVTTGIHSQYYTISNTFKGLEIGCDTTAIDEDQDYRNPNVYEDIAWTSGKTLSVAGSNPGPVFRGYAEDGKYFSHRGTQTCANNEWISHGLIGTPKVVLVASGNCTYDGVPVIVNYIHSTMNATKFQANIYWSNGTAISDDVILVSYLAEYKS